LALAGGMAVSALPCAAAADETSTPADKSSYNLFNPTPDASLRPLSLDALDGVVDPTTVDPGHVQVQGNLVDYYHYSTTFYRTVDFSEDHFNWSPRISLGLLNNVDFWVHPEFEETSHTYSGSYNASGSSSRFEQITLGPKINLWGNDGGLTAFSVAPYVSIPDGNHAILGGADISFAVRLPQQFYLKVMTDPAVTNPRNDTDYLGIQNSLSLHKTFGDKLDAYAYLDTEWVSSGEEWDGCAGFGAGYLVTKNLEVFVGIGCGLTDNSYDYNPRLGLGWRF
jgi:hypothetical protein